MTRPAAPATSRSLRVLIVDDEELGRRGIAARLARAADVQIVGECDCGEEAVAAIEALSPDVVFLDVQMPELDGLAVASRVLALVGAERMPAVVFVTAHDAHALRAFEVQALDYLLKPIDDDRFAEAIERARARTAERAVARAAREAVALDLDQDARQRLAIRSGARVTLVPLDDIDWIGADGDYVRVYVRGRNHLVRETITAVAERLPPTRFVRIHRSTIVNVDRVRELLPHTNRELRVVLQDGTRLQVSRGYRDRIAALQARAR